MLSFELYGHWLKVHTRLPIRGTLRSRFEPMAASWTPHWPLLGPIGTKKGALGLQADPTSCDESASHDWLEAAKASGHSILKPLNHSRTIEHDTFIDVEFVLLR